MFILLGITYIFIILISLFGDYKSKELEKQYFEKLKQELDEEN